GHISFLVAITGMDPLRTTCFYFLCIVFVILSPSCLCDSRRLGPMEKKLGVNRDHLIAENNEEITKQGVPSTNVKKTLLSEAPIEHDVANHGRQINGNSTKDDFRIEFKFFRFRFGFLIYKRSCLVYTNVSGEHHPRFSGDRHIVKLDGASSTVDGYVKRPKLSQKPRYMRRSLTLEKVNAAINDMASYAEANAHPISAPKQKVSLTYTMFIGLGVWLINNTTISLFKLNNTGKAILTVLRHLGRVSETRIGQNRVIILRNQIKFVSFHIVRGSGSLHHLGSLLLR
ncbi:unnamed protein product, partial [Brassica oleracea]